MCGFYAAALEQFLELLEVPAAVEVAGCQAMGHETCAYALVSREVVPAPDAARPERMLT